MLPILKALRTLLGYAFMLTLLINPFQIYYVVFVFELHWLYAINPVGAWYVICAIGALWAKNQYCIKQWYALDVLGATTCHGTHKRTISGWIGQHMSSAKRYEYLAMIIDFLATKVGDKANHCKREYYKERTQGLV